MNRLLLWRGHAWLSLAARLYLGGLFLAACIHKIAEPASFALDIATYQIVPLGLINLMALMLPMLELVSGGMLAIGFRTRAAALLIAGQMAMFTVAIAIALSNNLVMSCGCFASQGLADDPISGMTVVRDLGWLGLALYVLLFDRRPIGLDRLWPRRGPVGPASGGDG